MHVGGHGSGIFKQVVLLSIYIYICNNRSEREVLDGMLWIREGTTNSFWLVHMNQKMIGMMYGRIGWMALCSDISLELR